MKLKYAFFYFFATLLAAGLGFMSQSISESLLYGIDINQDGVISMEEWQGNQRTFEERDLNHDKILSGAELSSGMLRKLSDVTSPAGTVTRWVFISRTTEGDIFSSLDRNKDGVISTGEWQVPYKLFDQLDTNHNGLLDRTEFYQKIPPQ